MDSVNEKTFENPPVCLLVDNGSTVPDSILSARRIAVKLSERLGLEVQSVGLMHSDRVSAQELGGVAAETLIPYLQKRMFSGTFNFLFIPLFLGPSRALTEWLPRELEELLVKFPNVIVRVGECLACDPESEEALAQAVLDRIRASSQDIELASPFVAFVDHGTPEHKVNEVRERVGGLLRDLLDSTVVGFSTCSMERRSDPEFAFNEPLLANLLLDHSIVPSGNVVASLFFLLPGRHAGLGGDLQNIIEQAQGLRQDLTIHKTATLGEHPLVLDLLEGNFRKLLKDN